MIKIRRFRDEDAENLSKLVIKNIRTILPKCYEKKVINSLCSKMKPKKLIKRSKEREIFLAIKDNKLVGVIGFKDNEIKNLFVDINHLNQGISTKMLIYVENIIKKNNPEFIFVRSSLYAVNYYEKKGYKRVRKMKTDIGNKIYLESVYMKKYLR